MEGKRNRGEVTAELSEKVWARLCRENALVASEVWVDDARRVDFVAYRPHRPRDRSSNHATAAELESGTFTFVEVKSCMDDFTSGHGRTFEGDENWLVCPLELADSLASKGMLPKGAAVYSPDARGALRKRYDTSEFRQVRVAPAIELIWAMLRRKSSCETGALRGYCDEMDLLYDPAVESETKAALFDRFIASSSWHHTGAYARETEFFALDEAAVVGAFRELGPEETAERDRIRAQAAARVREAERHRREAECLFEYRFSCSPYSAMAYEAFHPELCERRVSKHRKQELVVYRLPDGSEPSGYAEMSVPADYADSSHVVPSVFISGTGGDRAWRDIDFDEAERKFAAAARRAAAFREGRPKLMQDEARRAAIRETRHRVCTAPILKSIKEIHR